MIAAGESADGAIALASIEPAQAARGTSIKLYAADGAALPAQTVASFLEACIPASRPNGGGCAGATLKNVPCLRAKATDSFCGTILPFDLPVGQYEARLGKSAPVMDADWLAAPFVSLRVTREATEGPELLGITPQVAYPADNTNGCVKPQDGGGAQPVKSANLVLSGSNFSLAGKDNRILVNGNELPVCWECDGSKQCAPCDIAGSVGQNGREIRLRGIPIDTYGGILSVAVNVGTQTTSSRTVVLSRVNPSTPRWYALAGMAGLLFILFLILSRNASKQIAGKPYKVMTAVMLDAETNTYSLSKFQFYMWTFTVVLGYGYLTLVRSLIQGTFEFADVPGNLPGILAVSVGTSVFATGVTSAVGSKGSGRVQPGWGDLLTVGGVVVPERVQFVVWTIVGVTAFLALTFLADPAVIQNLPSVPQGFLLLMGASSAGYLGGKMARKPGPIIMSAKGVWEIDPQQPAANARRDKLTFSIIGRNLAVDCGIRFKDVKVPYVRGSAATALDNVLELVTRDEKSSDDNLASELRLIVRDKNMIDLIVAMQEPQPAPPPAAAGAAQPAAEPNTKPEISVTNPDGQMAAWPAPITTQ